MAQRKTLSHFRRFGGKRYTFYGSYILKSDAKARAKKLRRSGSSAAVTQIKSLQTHGRGGWAVYYRNK